VKEQDLIDSVNETERAHEDAKVNLAKAKRAWLDAETFVIETRVNKDRAREALRVYRNTTPNVPLTLRETEIEGFRERNPGIVEWARERDQIEEDE
jgi:hypothetical protein